MVALILFAFGVCALDSGFAGFDLDTFSCDKLAKCVLVERNGMFAYLRSDEGVIIAFEAGIDIFAVFENGQNLAIFADTIENIRLVKVYDGIVVVAVDFYGAEAISDGLVG